MTIHARGPMTRKCSPGDKVTITGIYMPVPNSGFIAMKAGLFH
jgi:DNA replication licensing factor MCM7